VSAAYIVALIAAVGLFLFGLAQRARRRKELAAWAATQGFTFSHNPNRFFDERFPGFRCLRRGHSRTAYHISEGTRNGRPVIAFDYRYVVGHGKSRSVCRLSAVILQSRIALKPLYIRPEGIFDKLTEFAGIDDIDFESAEFSRAFYVKSRDRRWAYDVLHPRTMTLLLEMPRFSIEFDSTHVIVWKAPRFAPDRFEAAMAVAEGLLDRLPDYLIRSQSTEEQEEG